jgi:uncharacterized protein with PQ loop repeat
VIGWEMSLALVRYSPGASPWWVNGLGAIAGGLGVASQWPQVWRLWRRRQYAGLSTLSCVLNLLTPLGWTAYGIARHSGVQIVTNGTAAVGAAGIVAGLVLHARPRLSAWLPALVAGLLVLAATGLFAGSGPLGWLASAVTLSMALPQVALLIRDRRRRQLDVRGVSRYRWVLSALCNVFWFVYSIFVADGTIGFTSGVMLVSSVAVLVLCGPRAGRPADPESVPRTVDVPLIGGAVIDTPGDAEPAA